MASKRQRIICGCGGELQPPIPPKCPHCGGKIVAIRRRLVPRVWRLFFIGMMFGMLLGVLWLMTRE